MNIPGAAAITATSRQENSTLWKPISQIIPSNGTLGLKAQGIKFRASIPVCNAALSTLQYVSNAPLDLELDRVIAHVTIVVDDLGNFGCFNDCSTPQSVPLLATSTINVGQQIPTILVGQGIPTVIGSYDNLKATTGVTVGIVLLVVVVMAVSICVGLLEGLAVQREIRAASVSSFLMPKKVGDFLLDSIEVAKKVGTSIFGPDYTSYMRLVVLKDKIDHVFKDDFPRDDDQAVSASTVNDMQPPIVAQGSLETEYTNSLQDHSAKEDTKTSSVWPPLERLIVNSGLPMLHGANGAMRESESLSSPPQDHFYASPYNENAPLLRMQMSEGENWSPWSSFGGDSSSDESADENPLESSKDHATELGDINSTETHPDFQTFKGNTNSAGIIVEPTKGSSDETNKTIGTIKAEIATVNENLMAKLEGSTVSNESKDEDVAPIQAGSNSHCLESEICVIEQPGGNLDKDEEQLEDVELRIVLALSESTTLDTEEMAEAGLVFMSLEQDEEGSYVAVLAPKVDEVSSHNDVMDHGVG